jgi:hypothetical protein
MSAPPLSRQKVSPEDQAAIHEEVEAHSNAFDEMITRHIAEMKELKAGYERRLRAIPGYPSWVGWKAVHK